MWCPGVQGASPFFPEVLTRLPILHELHPHLPTDTNIAMSQLKLNGKCLAFHGPLLYEAKILKTREPGSKVARTKEGEEPIKKEDIPPELENEKLYYIHYIGWNSSWDEWVDIKRLRELSVENIKLQKEYKKRALNATSSVSAQAGGKRTIDVSKSLNGGGVIAKANKKRDDMDMETEEEFNGKLEINLLVPDSLKSILVDDWEKVTKEHYLLSLPSKVTVLDILNKYDNSLKMKKSNSEMELVKEFIDGMRVYFNRALGNLLLYRFERQQYLEVTRDPQLKSRELALVYGAEHLMRLIVSLPALIAQTTMDQQSVGTLKEQLEDFLMFMDRNKRSFFLKNYVSASPKYESLAKNS